MPCLLILPPIAWAQDNDQPDIAHIAWPAVNIELQFAPRFDAQFQHDAAAWVRQSAQVVADCWGRFPVPELEILLAPQDGEGVATGVSFGDPSALIRVRVGRDTTAQQFSQDWVLVHEMLHMAVLRLKRRHCWLHEGVATYCEGVAHGSGVRFDGHGTGCDHPDHAVHTDERHAGGHRFVCAVA